MLIVDFTSLILGYSQLSVQRRSNRQKFLLRGQFFQYLKLFTFILGTPIALAPFLMLGELKQYVFYIYNRTFGKLYYKRARHW